MDGWMDGWIYIYMHTSIQREREIDREIERYEWKTGWMDNGCLYELMDMMDRCVNVLMVRCINRQMDGWIN